MLWNNVKTADCGYYFFPASPQYFVLFCIVHALFLKSGMLADRRFFARRCHYEGSPESYAVSSVDKFFNAYYGKYHSRPRHGSFTRF